MHMSDANCVACGAVHGSVGVELNCLRRTARGLAEQLRARDEEVKRLERVAEGLRSDQPKFAPEAPERR
jgi:hypothetical protein